MSGELRRWLRERELDGPDRVQSQVTLAVAVDLDRYDLTAYATAKHSLELPALVSEIEGPPQALIVVRGVRQLLAEAIPS